MPRKVDGVAANHPGRPRTSQTRGGRGTVSVLVELVRDYPSRTVAILVCLVLSGLSEGISLVTLVPLLEHAAGGGGSRLGRVVVSVFSAAGLEASFGWLLILVVVGIALKAALLFLAMVQVGFAMTRVATDVRLGIVRALIRARWSHFVRQPIGIFSTAVSTEANQMASAYLSGCNLLAKGIQIFVYLGVAVIVSWQITLASVVAGILIAALLGRLVEISRRAGGRQVDAMNALVSRLTDSLQGIKPIKAMAVEERVAPLLEHETEELNRALRLSVISFEAMNCLREPMATAFLAAGLFIAVASLRMNLDAVLILAFLFFRMVGQLGLVQRAYQGLANNESALRSVRAKIAEAEANAERVTGRARPEFSEAILFDRVSFSYGRPQVLRDVSLAIPAGRITAVMGPSGAGKTTLSDLVLGFYQPDRGRITVDGVDLAEIDIRAWRLQIGYVPQDIFLFHDSVLRNVTLDVPGFGEAETEAALRAAGAWEFVSTLPQGLHTPVGERGASLSGGQRQRIAIARALVRNPRLLILDEPTTALDPETEAEICKTLQTLKRKVTILIISHQPALMGIADLIYEIRDGTVRTVQRELERQAVPLG